ncbi:winged helix-turn-helix domain-containing protein [Allobaculum stercoricanis]|uniref:winged helix-turn-helix domain-containing protein n=1 Tax=Allobaculum stercoricanis TaxID=174709 RepID=UPI002941E4B2|nr:winged helix-turn-helix domain-containing protein [Allobaculum stercoricanis]
MIKTQNVDTYYDSPQTDLIEYQTHTLVSQNVNGKREYFFAQPIPKPLHHITFGNQSRKLYDRPPRSWNEEQKRRNRVIQTGDLIVDEAGRQVYKNGVCIKLTPTQYHLVQYLCNNSTILCSRESLKNLTWKRTHRHIQDNTLTKHINRTRELLGQEKGCEYILTSNGMGYRWGMPVFERYIQRDLDLSAYTSYESSTNERKH